MFIIKMSIDFFFIARSLFCFVFLCLCAAVFLVAVVVRLLAACSFASCCLMQVHFFMCYFYYVIAVVLAKLAVALCVVQYSPRIEIGIKKRMAQRQFRLCVACSLAPYACVRMYV